MICNFSEKGQVPQASKGLIYFLMLLDALTNTYLGSRKSKDGDKAEPGNAWATGGLRVNSTLVKAGIISDPLFGNAKITKLKISSFLRIMYKKRIFLVKSFKKNYP